MSAPEEIVCETEEAYEAALAEHGVSPAVMNCPDFPASYTTYKAVRIVYRPSPPSPALSGPLCPRCGAVMERIELGLNIESWRCRADGMFHPFTPPLPRDEAREAWSSWVLQRFLPTSPALSSDANVNLLREAFMAGRASVRP